MGSNSNQNNIVLKITKATIRNIIVALLLATVFLIIIYGLTREEVNTTVSLLKTISIETNKQIASNIVFNKEEKTVRNRPEFGTQYAQIKIESLGIDIPLYHGDSLSLLRNGAGQMSSAYFPGEGGTVVCMAHNTDKMFKRLPEIENGAKIVIETSYGIFEYEVYNTKIIDMHDVDEIEIQDKEEILDVFTCYPVNGIGHRTQRFVAYSKLVNYIEP